MRTSRLYIADAKLGELRLNEERSNYVRNVLRLKKGAELKVFNGMGFEFHAKLIEIQHEKVLLNLTDTLFCDVESPIFTHLGIGISRGERMDLAIQKAVELGVSEITPLFTERCVVHLEGERLTQRLNHWQKIAQSACEQCGRNRVPQIYQAVKIETWVVSVIGLKLLLHPHHAKKLTELKKTQDKICLLSGPEGGFSEHEREFALKHGFISLNLGPRILRTETAALAALASIQTLWGDMG